MPRPVSPSPGEHPQRNPQLQALQPLLDRLRIHRWDALLIGDGSGSGWQIGCGWSCALIDKATAGRRLFHGAANSGTAMFAEWMAYVAPLQWYQYYRDKQRIKTIAQIHIVTDNQALSLQGRKYRQGITPDANQAFWGAIAGLEQSARMVIYLHWQERDSTALNGLMDVIAGNSRTTLRDMHIPGAELPLSDYLYQANVHNHEVYRGLHRP